MADFLDQFGLAPSGSVLEFAANLALGFGLSLSQYVVLRFVLGYNSGATRAWVPVSTLLFGFEYFVDAFWLRNAPSVVAVPASIVQAAIYPSLRESC